MACPRCRVVPDAHSFTYFGLIGDIHYYYSSAAKARDYKESPETLGNYIMHTNLAKGKKWAWIVDCKGMKMNHYPSLSLVTKMTKFLKDEHQDFLTMIYVVHPNTWVKNSIQLWKKIVPYGNIQKITTLEGEKLELLVSLKNADIHGEPLIWLMNVFKMPDEPCFLPDVAGAQASH
jgi:hypothetical protein